MTLQGKGFFTINLLECEGGEPAAILAEARAAGLSHVIFRIADGVNAAGIDSAGFDITAPVVQALRLNGFAAWGWHTIHGNQSAAEAEIAIARMQALGLDGLVVHTGDGYERPGMEGAARQYMAAVRAALAVPIALSSHRFPNYHPEIPWATLLEFCDLHMPRVFWEQAQNAGEQLRESIRQCDALPNARICVPTGAAYTTASWSPSAEEINEFLNTARDLGLPAANFYNWDACRQSLPSLWTAVASFDWPAPALEFLQRTWLACLPMMHPRSHYWMISWLSSWQLSTAARLPRSPHSTTRPPRRSGRKISARMPLPSAGATKSSLPACPPGAFSPSRMPK